MNTTIKIIYKNNNNNKNETTNTNTRLKSIYQNKNEFDPFMFNVFCFILKK